MRFHRGTSYPNEAFVQEALVSFFERAGFDVEIDTNNRTPDVVCRSGSETWVIETKGQSQAIGTDFNTGLGQILKWMADADTKYAVAVPATEQYKRQCGLVLERVRQKLGLHWIFVHENGEAEVSSPFESHHE